LVQMDIIVARRTMCFRFLLRLVPRFFLDSRSSLTRADRT